jgi:hypothetical protein
LKVRNRIAVILLVGTLSLPAGLMAKAYRIGVDPRVELMSILFRLAGNNEYTQGRVPGYIQAIDRHFAPYRDHQAVQLARQLRKNDGVSFDAVMSMAVHIKDVQSLAERVPFDRQDLRLDKRWHGVKARTFLEAARRFVADTSFAEFLRSQEALYDVTNSRLQTFVKTNTDLEWFDRFFGARSLARFIIVPGLVNGGPSYGASLIAEDGMEEVYAIPGVWQVDSEGLPRFSGNWIETLVHEFVHSYANPLIDKFAPQLEKAGRQLNEPVREAMQAQAYGPWKTLLYESLVRAATVRYILEHRGQEAARRAIQYEHSRSFLWTGELVELLAQYENDRESYPTLESFMPKVVEFFDAVAPRAGELARRYDESRPKVATMNITNGAQDVDPNLTEIVIRFDRPMRRTSYAVARKNAARFPKVGKVRFDETGTIFTIPVTLEPGRDYEFSLNWPGGGSFASEDGTPLKHVPVRFRTRAATSSPAQP